MTPPNLPPQTIPTSTPFRWFDSSTRTLDRKITRGAEFVTSKLGAAPTLVWVHPQDSEGYVTGDLVGGLPIFVTPGALARHFLFWTTSEIESGIEVAA